MSKSSKRILSLLLSLVIVVSAISVLPIQVVASSQGEDVIRIAKSQIGQYSRPNKFSNHLGIGSDDWCAAFAVWCAHTAGVSNDVVPSIASSTSLLVWYNQRGRWHRKNGSSWSYAGKSDNSAVDSTYQPQTGDIILLETNNTYSDGPDHTALVASVSNGTVYTVEGNISGNKVGERSYSASASKIWGYCNPAYSGSPILPTPTTDNYNPDNHAQPTRDIWYQSTNTMTGDDVSWIQAVLYQLGYGVSVDGSFGPATKAAVQQFQSNNGLTVDGSVGPATRQALINAWNNKKGNNPTGYVDGISGGTGTVTVRGWTFDKDDPTKSLNVHVYIGGSVGTSGTEGYPISANVSRPDVDNVHHVGEFHGYDITIPTSKTGEQDVYIYAINIGGGENVELGHKRVNISADTEIPTFEKTYLSEITHDTYRVCAIPKDNVGIKKVRVATWTQSNQSDLIWHDATNNGYGTYFVDIKRSDYSNTSNSYYSNHVYAYDYAGNARSIAVNKDYRITSDTGKSVPEGEYRIVTAVNENRALDIYGAFTDNGTNVQIYSNLEDRVQTFDIKYIGDGFYTIFNTHANKPLDVNGDTYTSGTNIVISDYHNGANQQWMIKPSNDGYYYIIARSNDLALDVKGAVDADSTNVQAHTQNQSVAQKWKLRRVLNDSMVSIEDFTLKDISQGINPNITVTSDDKALIEGTDYTVSVTVNTDLKSGEVNVTGIGNYCDSVKKTFKIVSSTTEPSTDENKPTESVAETTELTSKPTEPVSETTESTSKPTEPVTEKTEPTSKPTEPVTDPPVTEPTMTPTESTTEPGEDEIYDGTTGSCKWEFNRTTGTLVISGTGEMEEYKTRSSVSWYKYRTEVKKVIFKDGVTNIGSHAFDSDSNLTEVILSDSVKSIGKQAFIYCSSLKSISSLKNIETIAESAFTYCSNLDNLEFSDKIKYIGANLTSTKWYSNHSDGLIYIGKIAYRYKGQCPDEVVIKDGTESITNAAFMNRSTLKSIVIPESITEISKEAFIGCSKLSKVKMGNNITSIGAHAFRACNSLTEISIPKSVSDIGEMAFGYYYSDGSYVKVDNFKIYGYKESAAEAYANENGFNFVDVEATPTTEPTTEEQEPTTPETEPTTPPTEPTTAESSTEPISENVPKIIVSNAKAVSGEEFDLDVDIENNPGITSLSFKVEYPDEFELIGVDYTDLFSSKPSNSNTYNSPFSISWFSGSSKDEDNNGKFATLKFKAKDGVESGEYIVKIAYESDNIFNSQFVEVKFDVDNGKVTVESYLPGDINNDKKVNMKDIVLLQQYINGWKVNINEKASDVTGDGKINMKDLVLLQQYINGWEVELK